MDGWMNGWMDGWMDRQMDNIWIHSYMYISLLGIQYGPFNNKEKKGDTMKNILRTFILDS